MVPPPPDGILVRDGAVQDVSDDLHVAMGMGRKARPALDPVFIDHPQGAEAFIGRVVIIAKGKAVARIQPGDLGPAAVFGAPDGDHLRLLSIASQIRAAISAPPKRLTSWMPVGEVTLISVR